MLRAEKYKNEKNENKMAINGNSIEKIEALSLNMKTLRLKKTHKLKQSNY